MEVLKIFNCSEQLLKWTDYGGFVTVRAERPFLKKWEFGGAELAISKWKWSLDLDAFIWHFGNVFNLCWHSVVWFRLASAVSNLEWMVNGPRVGYFLNSFGISNSGIIWIEESPVNYDSPIHYNSVFVNGVVVGCGVEMLASGNAVECQLFFTNK